MFGSICPCGIEGFSSLDKREIFVLSDFTCIYEHAGHRRVCKFMLTLKWFAMTPISTSSGPITPSHPLASLHTFTLSLVLAHHTYPLSCVSAHPHRLVCAHVLSLSPPTLARVLFKLLSIIVLLSRLLVPSGRSINQPMINTSPSPSMLWFLLVMVSMISSLVTAGCSVIERLLWL